MLCVHDLGAADLATRAGLGQDERDGWRIVLDEDLLPLFPGLRLCLDRVFGQVNSWADLQLHLARLLGVGFEVDVHGELLGER
ncbi:MAG: hypothetical protein ACRDRT_15295, partial [Pseudonocardiaceae bacterium]